MSDTQEHNENAPDTEAPKKKLNAEAARRVMRDTLSRVRRLGAGAADLMRKLKKDRSPQAMLGTIEQSAEANRLRREEVSARIEKQYAAITERKKAFSAAPPARKRILEAELSSLLSQYKASERELAVLLENEKVLAQTRGRIQELMAYGMAGVTELQIDDLVEEVEDSVSDAEGRLDAVRDLETAGRRRERASDKESLWAELDGFGEEEEGGEQTPERGSRVEGREEQAPEDSDEPARRKEPEPPE